MPRSTTSVAGRSQAQRREATREALLEATLASLAEVGWAATTTRAVAERAGVSQGAQQHHFPTKAALVVAALHKLAGQLAAAALEGLSTTAPRRTEQRIAVLLERLWEIHNLPLNTAFLELVVAARTEPEIARDVAQLVAEATELTCAVAGELLPALAGDPRLREWVLITLAAIRGSVLVALPGTEAARPDWPALRESLLRAAPR